MGIIVKNFWMKPQLTYNLKEFEFGYIESSGKKRHYKVTQDEDYPEAFHEIMWTIWNQKKKNHLPWTHPNYRKWKDKVNIETKEEKMISIAEKLKKLANDLTDKFAIKMRIKPPRRRSPQERLKARLYYRKNRSKIRLQRRRYLRQHKTTLKRRKQFQRFKPVWFKKPPKHKIPKPKKPSKLFKLPKKSA